MPRGQNVPQRVLHAAARQRGGANPARPAATDQRGDRRRRMDRHDRQRSGRADAAARDHPQHHRPSRSSIIIPIEDARSLHRIEDPDVGDMLWSSRRSGPRAACSSRRTSWSSARSRPLMAWRCSRWRTTQRNSRERIIMSRPAGFRCRRSSTPARRAIYRRHVLDASRGVRSPGRFHRAQVAIDHGRGRRAGVAAADGALRSRALLSRPRHVSGGQGGPGRGAGRQSDDAPRTPRRCAARHRQYHDRPRRRGGQGSLESVRRQSA